MNDEWFTAIALPVSVAADAQAHVTVFIAPRLTPDGDEAVLGDFALFSAWGERVRDGLDLTLLDQNGPIDTHVDVAAVDPAVWDRAFPKTTPVRSNRVPRWQQRDWRTFSAKDAADIAKTIHLATVAADPVNPVAPLAHPLTEGIVAVASEAGALRMPNRENRGDPPVYDESVLTRMLDETLPRGADGAWTSRRPTTDLYTSVSAGESTAAASVASALRELHRVRRFYERPESQAEAQHVKSPPDKVTRVEHHQPEFHERAAAAGDHREFLLRLGLLIPLRVDTDRLRHSEWLAVLAGAVPDGCCRSPRLAVQVTSDESFVARPSPSETDIWSGGALALGDADIFDVIDIDPDGSAIKAERFLTTLPRLAIAQWGKMPVDAASPALRATGLTVTRRQQAGRALTQLQRQEGYEAALSQPQQPQDLPLLHTQDITRGYRVEVWDSVTRVWRSLHTRRSTLIVDGMTVYRDELGDGFIQGTSATETRGVAESAIHVHEAMFGWDGWSLSAPRPGRRVRAQIEDADSGGSRIVETVEDVPESPQPGEVPPHPFVFSHRFAEGTLPRLRYGRDYSFRAWGVDLGGNVRPHHVGPRTEAESAQLRAQTQRVEAALASAAAFQSRVDDLARRDVLGGIAEVARGLHLATVARADTTVSLEGEKPQGESTPTPAVDRATSVEEQLLDSLDVEALERIVRAADLGRSAWDAALATSGGDVSAATDNLGPARARRLGPRGVEAIDSAAPRTVHEAAVAAGWRVTAVEDTFRAAVADTATPLARSTLVTDIATIRDLVASQVGAWVTGVPGGGGVPGTPASAEVTPEVTSRALRTVTPPRPFLRWDPVPVPVLVPLAAFTEGESLRVLVVRSGVSQNPETLEVTTVDPEEYAIPVAETAPLYRGSAQRHVAPPKTSQVQAELHGVFDEGIDDGTPAARRRMLAWALRENGTFFDQSVPHPSDPDGTPAPQVGVRLLPEPDGSDHFNPSDPANPLKVLPPGDAQTPDELILRPGDAPAPGQYVVHSTPRLALPYLPDPLATGVALAFTHAGADRVISFPFASEGITARYGGAWPELEPFLLSLTGGAELSARIDGHLLEIALPPGDVQTFRLSSSVPAQRLEWMGVWRSLDDRLTRDDAVREAAADGLLWGLTPGEAVTLVHAVPRPISAPRPTQLAVYRPAGSTLVTLIGGLEVHGPSTEQVSATMRWTDTIDDTTSSGPVERASEAVGFTTSIHPHERIAPLWAADQTPTLPGWEGVILHGSAHSFPDTKHHRARYRFRASTRFREYFAPALLTPDAGDPLDDGQSVVSAEIELSVPSTVRPDAPRVHSVLPLLRWGETEEPEQPFGRRRSRAAGLRIYLERPWFSSGDGELLAVLLAVGGDDTQGYPPQKNPAEGFPFVSQWGSDPIWNGPGVIRRAMTLIELDDALSLTKIDDRLEAGRPVAKATTLPLPLGSTTGGSPDTVPVVAVGYRPQYNERRQLWYVDVAVDSRATFWPFLRLAVARYQPESVGGAHLSTPVQLDFVQLAPQRTTSVSRTDDRHARVVVTGFAAHRMTASRNFAASVAAHRRVVARLQRYRPEIGGDLAWESVDAVELQIRGSASRTEELVWVGEVRSDVPIDVRTPRADDGEPPRWRVRVEEWERFEGDPPPREEVAAHGSDPVIQERLVYADDISL